MTRECEFQSCDRPAVEQLEYPICSKHARNIYVSVQNLLENATPEQRAEASTPIGRVRPKRGKHPGVVYFMRFGRLVKIGYTENLRQRTNALRPDEVLGWMHGSMQDEKALHARFREAWVGGEMFESTPDLLAFVRELRPAA